MPLYFIGYDVASPIGEQLDDLLARWGGASLYHGAWLLDREVSALDLRNAIQGFLAVDDPAIVLELKPGSWWASEHVTRTGQQWLKAHVLA